MTTIWERAQHLKGTTLHTTVQGKLFDIIDVRSDRIVFVPQDGNGTERWVSREQIEHIAGFIKPEATVSPSLVREQYPNDRNTSYIAALVQSING